MSAWLSFYEISKPEGLPDGVVDLDASEDVSYADAETTSEWQRNLGVLRDAEIETLDLFSAAESEFGERPESVSFRPFRAAGAEYEYVFRMKDGTSKSVLDFDFDKYKRKKRFKAYLFVRKEVSDAERPEPLVVDGDFSEKELTLDDFEVLIERCLASEKDGACGALENLLAVMKARAAALKGSRIVSILD